MVISESARREAMTRKKEAEERSPGMVTSQACSVAGPWTPAPDWEKRALTPKDSSMRSVWSRDGLGSVTRVVPLA